MKPEQFIREFGVEKARDLLDQREKFIHVDKPTHFYADADYRIFFHIDDITELDELDVDLSDLKRLVESIDLVESWGGIEDLKLYDLSHCKDKPESAGYKLLQAIADYESIYGGGDE